MQQALQRRPFLLVDASAAAQADCPGFRLAWTGRPLQSNNNSLPGETEFHPEIRWVGAYVAAAQRFHRKMEIILFTEMKPYGQCIVSVYFIVISN